MVSNYLYLSSSYCFFAMLGKIQKIEGDGGIFVRDHIIRKYNVCFVGCVIIFVYV